MHYSESHIHQLPVELLQHIFSLIVNDISDCPSIFNSSNRRISGNFSSPPLVFTRVCRLWRVTAHSTPDLWSRIQVTLPGGDESSEPFLPCLLQSWLACSGGQPLTLRIDRVWVILDFYIFDAICGSTQSYRSLSHADYRLLEILQAESRRWETVVCALRGDEWLDSKLDTPHLGTLECSWSGLNRFNAPNLRQLRISKGIEDIATSPTLTCKNLRHLRVQYTSSKIIRSISMIFPLLQTITVAAVTGDHDDARSHSVTYPCLESLTLPLPSYDDVSDWLTEIFDGLHLPVLRKLTLVGYPSKWMIDRTMAALAVTATCNLEVIDFHTSALQGEIDVDVVEPLLSVVKEISVESVLFRCRSPRN
ncbi:uncharacterized protein F5891DRAFT_390573 [Suillus fuscotomentosus]|uniref:F-box domain-containing protein n=1 Tax=Suillus fuscotomentosus TaxID=1912939 RepID=A0AAD4HK79_9AGAM|nr:uncharacterized protein F5891DRAFT_390573 [Suillus fuscotomentosus]KAG1899653.1 hypothetical protein F5891DRAFT_390573 [Suillus fuscotomentosus]